MWPYNHHYRQQPPQNQMGDRSMWLKGEFAASNAIIDALCHHLQLLGEPGEYDDVMGSIQQRRCNWTAVLDRQQHVPVTEVLRELQQVGWKRQQQRGVGLEKESRRGGFEGHDFGGEVNAKGFRNGHMKSGSPVNEKLNGVGDKPKEEETKDGVEQKGEQNETHVADTHGSTNGDVPHIEEKVEVSDSCNVVESKLTKQKRDFEVLPKTFVAQEIYGGKQVNVVDGLKLFVKLIEESDISKLLALVSGLRADGEMGRFKGLFSSKRPMNGHGRVVIQLGNNSPYLPSEDADNAGIHKDLKPEPIPDLLQDVIEQLLNEQVVSIKPDSCIIDIYCEGDYSPPRMWPASFGRPVCLLFLSKCEMSFGKSMPMDRPGEFKGALKLVISSGSMLVVEGNSADLARHSVTAMPKKRTLVTFFKSQPKKTITTNIRPPARSPQRAPPPPPGRQLNHIRPRHFTPVPPPPNGMLMTSSPLMNPLSNSMYVPMVAVPAVPFGIPPPAPSGWLPHHRPLPPLTQGPGTGFFLPSQQKSAFHHQFELTEYNVNDDSSRKGSPKDSQEK